MKRFIAIIVAVLFLAISYFVFSYFAVSFEKNTLANALEKDKYTEKEYKEFHNRLDDKSFYYYNTLTDSQKDSYITLYYSALNFDESCKVEIAEEDLSLVIDAIMYDNSEIFWLTGNCSYYVNEGYIEVVQKYRYAEDEAKRISEKLEDKVDEIISEMPDYKTDFEKELYLHDYVCDNTIYDENTMETTGHTAHSSLLDGKTVCEGYARAVQLLLDEVGIENHLIIGEASDDNSEELHMWNIVKIDGHYYHLDSTWNDGAFTDAQGYFYFNVPDTYIMRTHSDFNIRNTGCSYNHANYFEMMNTYVKTFTGFANLTDAAAGVLVTGENVVEFVFETKSDYKRALNELQNNTKFFSFVEQSVKKSGRNLLKNSVFYNTADIYNYLSIEFKEG